MTDCERRRISEGMMACKPGVRLACQTFVNGSGVVVKRLGARPGET
jgi:hypothetical protein